MMMPHRKIKLSVETVVLAVCMFFVFCYLGSLRTPSIFCSIFLLLFISLMKTRGTVIYFSSETYVLFVLLLTQLARVFANTVAGTFRFSHIIYFAIYTMLFICISRYRHIDSCFFIKLLNVALLFSFVGGPVLGMYQFITKEYIYHYLESTQQAAYNSVSYMMFSVNNGNSNYASIHMMLTMYLCMLKYKMTSKSLYLIMTLFSGIAVILTFSRATLLAIAMVLFFVLINKRHGINKADAKQRRKFRMQVFVICLVLFCAVLLMFDSICNLLINYFSNSFALKNMQYKLSSSGADSRFVIWNATFNMMKDATIDKLLFGFGDEYTIHLMGYCGMAVTAHNYVIDQFARCGVVGLILSLSFCVLMVKQSVYYLRMRDSILKILGAIMLSLLINYMFVAEMDFVTLIALAITSSFNKEVVRL